MARPKLGPIPQGQWVDPKTGIPNRHVVNWFNTLKLYLPDDETGVLAEALGGTGVSNVAQLAAAIGAASTDTSSGTALTQSKNAILTQPATNAIGDSEDTVVTWASAFSDANYTATVAFDTTQNHRGAVTIAGKTATTITLTLTNTADGSRAVGTAVVTGVHT